ncbi:MAG: heme-binding domain-containing protein [candidate division KSB1 bacterium]|nr:heme-binding domain-containing protein [candidate division KSB1 bacterium]MDZ7304912.1 heme-binding domain-containing protein [candidate division KSB1 bacterium]MDZ7313952.1 heme-binding domain-containing protein [candidate division KSB1 bacterium]
MKKILKGVVVTFFAAFIIIQFFGPKKINPPFDRAQSIEANTQMTQEIAAIFERSCQDCHSYKTRWPWYSQVAPVSWLLIDHVTEGRRHLNFSEWASYDSKKARKLLGEISDEVQKGDMPLKSYLPLHPKARLSEVDVQAIVAWTTAERQRLAGENALSDE